MGVSSTDRQRLTGEEIEYALDQAEALLDAADRSTARSHALTVGGVVGSALVAAVAALPVLLSPSVGAAVVLLAGLALGSLAFATVSSANRAARTVRDRDARAMLEMVDIIRELLPDIADYERWSPARYQLTRARVARFPVGGRSSR